MNNEMRKIHFGIVSKFIDDMKTMLSLEEKIKGITASEDNYVMSEHIRKLRADLLIRTETVALSFKKLFIEDSVSDELTVSDIDPDLSLSTLIHELKSIP